MIFLDLDGFKRVNDFLGLYRGGSSAATALWFEKNLWKGDVVARYGGDGFSFLVPGLTQEEAEGVMEGLTIRFMEKNLTGELQLGFSYGMAVYPHGPTTLTRFWRFRIGNVFAETR